MSNSDSSDSWTNNHVSFDESDWEGLNISSDSDSSEHSSSLDTDQDENVNSWLNNQNTSDNIITSTAEETNIVILETINVIMENQIANFGLLSFDIIFDMTLEELEDYEDRILIQETIPNELVTTINLHLFVINHLINNHRN